jgi:hypothetical protein
VEARQGIAWRFVRLRTLFGRLLVGGTDGNRRLTATTALVLLVLLAAEGATLLALRPLLSLHVFLGMLLIPPVALKLASIGYRFGRYYGVMPPTGSKGRRHC